MTHPLMEYLPPVQQQHQPHPTHGASKYFGSVAQGYDAKRKDDAKWTVEQAIIEGWLNEIPDGSTVLDAPIGTGRFIDTYAKKGFKVFGLDRSEDMLRQAAAKMPAGFSVNFGVGNVMTTGLPDKSVDVALNIRITRWLIEESGPEGIVQMVREMQRVAREGIILTARMANHKWAVTTDLIKSALNGWTISRDVAGYVTDYRILLLRPSA
jgi:ubiquinone/menaquinone biosynthesis C-methylase UbiE